MAIIIVKAAPGRRVRDPRTMKVLPPGGLHVDDQDLHWIRKLKVGDVVKVEQPPAADAAAKRAKS